MTLPVNRAKDPGPLSYSLPDEAGTLVTLTGDRTQVLLGSARLFYLIKILLNVLKPLSAESIPSPPLWTSRVLFRFFFLPGVSYLDSLPDFFLTDVPPSGFTSHETQPSSSSADHSPFFFYAPHL